MPIRGRWSSAAVIVALVATSGGFAATSAGARPARPAGSPHPEDWCSGSRPAPCVVALSQDGTAIASTDTTWVASISNDFTNDGDTGVQWSVSNQDAGVHDNGNVYESMGDDQATHLWSMTVRVDQVPRSISGYFDQLQTTVTPRRDGTYDVTTTGYPVTTGVNDECQPVTPESCPYQAGADVTIFQAQADDFQYSSIPSSQWNDYNGLREWTNVEESDLPPLITGDPLQITEQLTNSHKLATGDVFEGFFHAVLPNAFLVDMGIDDPSTIDASSISTSIGSGTATVVPGPSSTEVDITGITFSHRVLRIKRGTITPTRPRISAIRRRGTRVRVAFRQSKPRGSHIVRYQARCGTRGVPTVTGTGKRSPVTVAGLVPHRRYTCKVRAKSRAGYGGWSTGHRINT